MTWRFIAQRVLTGEFLSWDVPLTLSSNPRRDLSGPGGMVGTITPEWKRLIHDDGRPVIDEWSTAIFAEDTDSHRIRWGGLVTESRFTGQTWEISCAGFTAYPHGIPYLGPAIRAGRKLSQKDTTKDQDKNHDGYVDGTTPPKSTKVPAAPKPTITDPIDAFEVVRRIWDHVQNQPGGNLGLTVDGDDSGHLLGAKDGSDPYELAWWDAPDCGETIDSLAQEVPFDYVESHQWDDDTDTINHHLSLDKRLGRRRHDLRFAMGENVTAIAEPSRLGDAYANEVFALGKGQGTKTVRAHVPGERNGHLRRVAVITHKHISHANTLRRLGQRELHKRAEEFYVPLLEVRQHDNARIGSWHLGDIIQLDLDLPWLGELAVWHRIIGEELSPDGRAILTLTAPEL